MVNTRLIIQWGHTVTPIISEYQAKVRENIILAGGGSRIAGIEDYLAKALKDFAECSFTRIDDPRYGGANGALALVNEMPEEHWAEMK